MQSVRYFLKPHVFLAPAERYVVILDVRRDRYLCVLRSQFDSLVPWLSGWPGDNSSGACSSAPPAGPVAAIAAAFIAQDILTRDTVDSKPVAPLSSPTPKARALPRRRPSFPSILQKTASFLRACHRADVMLGNSPFERVVDAVRKRSRASSGDTEIPAERLLRLVAIFEALRPIYPRPHLCTFDSLALLEFLARHGIHPRWVFGVCADPFHAHCWVQLGETVLNDRIERVLHLVPIMAV